MKKVTSKRNSKPSKRTFDETGNLWLAFARMNHPHYPETVRCFVRGKGAYLFDGKGKKYFDAFSTLWTNLIGHGREEMVSAMSEQLRRLSFMHLFSGSQHEPALRLSQKLVELSPFSHRYCFFGCSGSDATDTAIKLARQYWYSKGNAQKNVIVGRRSTYHGTTYGALTLMGHDDYQAPFTPLVGRMHRVPPPTMRHWNVIFVKSMPRPMWRRFSLSPSLPRMD